MQHNHTHTGTHNTHTHTHTSFFRVCGRFQSPGYLVVMAVVLLTLAVFEYIQFAMYERVTGTIAAALPPSDVTWDGARDAFAAPAADESDAFDFEAAGVPLEALG